MSQGVPRNPPELELQQAITDATLAGAWGYCPAEGELVLREALVNEMKISYGGGDPDSVDVTPDDVAITAGCNMAFVAAIMALADHGDEVILPVPWYVFNLTRNHICRTDYVLHHRYFNHQYVAFFPLF